MTNGMVPRIIIFLCLLPNFDAQAAQSISINKYITLTLDKTDALIHKFFYAGKLTVVESKKNVFNIFKQEYPPVSIRWAKKMAESKKGSHLRVIKSRSDQQATHFLIQSGGQVSIFSTKGDQVVLTADKDYLQIALNKVRFNVGVP